MDWGSYLCIGPERWNSMILLKQRENNLFSKLENLMRSSGFTPFSCKVALQYIKKEISNQSGKYDFQRVINHLLNEINRKPRVGKYIDEVDRYGNTIQKRNWQNGCPELIPGLTAKAFWSRNELPWIADVENCFSEIKQEFMSNRENIPSIFQPYRSPHRPSEKCSSSVNLVGHNATDNGFWNVCYLFLHGVDFDDNLEYFPKTRCTIENTPHHYHHAFFSCLAANTHVVSHHGPTNKKLRCHLPLFVPRDDNTGESCAWIRVGDEKVYFEEGQCIIFDDSYEHEAGNDHHTKSRIVLIFDVWHPDLSSTEIKFLQFWNNAQAKAAKRIQAEVNILNAVESSTEKDNSDSDFLSVIIETKKTRSRIPEDQLWGKIPLVRDD